MSAKPKYSDDYGLFVAIIAFVVMGLWAFYEREALMASFNLPASLNIFSYNLLLAFKLVNTAIAMGVIAFILGAIIAFLTGVIQKIFF